MKEIIDLFLRASGLCVIIAGAYILTKLQLEYNKDIKAMKERGEL